MFFGYCLLFLIKPLQYQSESSIEHKDVTSPEVHLFGLIENKEFFLCSSAMTQPTIFMENRSVNELNMNEFLVSIAEYMTKFAIPIVKREVRIKVKTSFRRNQRRLESDCFNDILDLSGEALRAVSRNDISLNNDHRCQVQNAATIIGSSQEYGIVLTHNSAPTDLNKKDYGGDIGHLNIETLKSAFMCVFRQDVKKNDVVEGNLNGFSLASIVSDVSTPRGSPLERFVIEIRAFENARKSMLELSNTPIVELLSISLGSCSGHGLTRGVQQPSPKLMNRNYLRSYALLTCSRPLLPFWIGSEFSNVVSFDLNREMVQGWPWGMGYVNLDLTLSSAVGLRSQRSLVVLSSRWDDLYEGVLGIVNPYDEVLIIVSTAGWLESTFDQLNRKAMFVTSYDGIDCVGFPKQFFVKGLAEETVLSRRWLTYRSTSTLIPGCFNEERTRWRYSSIETHFIGIGLFVWAIKWLGQPLWSWKNLYGIGMTRGCATSHLSQQVGYEVSCYSPACRMWRVSWVPFPLKMNFRNLVLGKGLLRAMGDLMERHHERVPKSPSGRRSTFSVGRRSLPSHGGRMYSSGRRPCSTSIRFGKNQQVPGGILFSIGGCPL